MFPTQRANTTQIDESKKRVIFHIDYDSFFASVEQQANPFLRGRPIGVTGSSLTKGVVCAASVEAKAFGVKTAMPMFKAKQLCPHIMGVKGDGTKYTYIQKESLKIFEKHSDLVEPFSIDESFLDVTETVKFFESPTQLALKIKREVLQKFGPFVTCSIGVGPNKLMAKLVSDLNKPNGLFIVDENNIEKVLKESKLTDFCGIGNQIEKRLNKLNVYNIEQLQQMHPEILYKEFGNVGSKFLHHLSQGVGFGNVSYFHYKSIPKSIGHQHTLSRNTRNPEVIKNNIRRLCEMVAVRLRKNEMVGKTISLYLRDSLRSGYGERQTLLIHTDDGRKIYKAAEEIMLNMNWKKETRLVGVSISNLILKNNMPLNLFPEEQKNERTITAMDMINNKFGEFTMITADTIRADTTKGKISSFLRH